MIRIYRYFILGAIGGFLGWALVEPINYLTPYVRPGDPVPSMSLPQGIVLGVIVGMLIGLALGVAEALSGVSPRDAVKSFIIGGLIGAGGGAIGLTFGNAIYGTLHAMGTGTLLGFVFELVGRSIGWALVGLAIGLAQGIATQSTKKMTNGAIGGVIGGGVGGFVFAILALLNSPTPGASTGTGIGFAPEFMRMLSFSITGAGIGLFIGLVEELTKQAWVVHLKGRNEGKEFLIFKPETIFGRDELIDVPIFGDPDVEPRHFVIKADQRRHMLQDLGTVSGTTVNGQKVVQPQLLRDGDMIQVGMTKFRFRDKATQSRISRPVDNGFPGAQIPTSAHVCPYCGEIKDANGNCACTVGAGAPANPAAQPTQMQPPQYQPTQMSQPTQPASTQPTPIADPFAPPSTGMPRMVGVSGPFAGQSYELNLQGDTTIGRQTDMNIALSSDNTVSRQHARIANENGHFVIYDLGSANGTYVNGNKINSQALANGDMVQVGSTKFRFEG